MAYVKSGYEAAMRTSATVWMARKRARKNAGRPEVDLGPALGSLGRCWCGQPVKHDWPGKVTLHGMSIGAPHP